MAKRKQQDNVEFNMTPMIDVTFQLIIFFIIAGTIVSDELEALKVPEPTNTIAREEFNEDTNIIVNIVSKYGDEDRDDIDPVMASRADAWYVRREKIDVGDIETLSSRFKAAVEKLSEKDREKFTIEIRSDYRIKYADVETVMLAAADAGVPKMNITAIVDTRQ